MLGPGELRVGAAASEAPPFKTVVDEAEDGDEKVLRSTREDLLFVSVGLVATERREVFSLVQALNETCTRG